MGFGRHLFDFEKVSFFGKLGHFAYQNGTKMAQNGMNFAMPY